MTKRTSLFLIFLVLLIGQIKGQYSKNIITSDIDNFWLAYDEITNTEDSILQHHFLDSLYIQRGSLGLKGMMQARNYTAEEYISAINNYPGFWKSIRTNTLKANDFGQELNDGIEKIRSIYPELKPAKIYFTIGALRSGGTYLDSLVLIGSEIAMSDKNTVSSELPEQFREGRRQYFDSNPIEDLILLNVHEYVHTQQNPLVHNLLSYCLHEGVAEFVSTIAMGIPSASPAIGFGKQNIKVKQKFEEVMFYGNNVSQWLWSDATNEFNTRDLGYYIGYQICELYYEQAKDKSAAIKKMIELDYTNEAEIEDFINASRFFSKSIEELYENFEAKRPIILNTVPFANESQNVNHETTQITINFSQSMNQEHRNFDYGPLGEKHAIRIKNIIGFSDDGKTMTIEVEKMSPGTRYQLTIGSGFRNLSDVPLMPYLIDFKTAAQ